MPLSVTIPTDAVSPVVGGGYIVPSKSCPDTFRLVWGNECSCPATGPACRHRKLVAAWCAEQDAKRRRPAGKVNVGLLVD